MDRGASSEGITIAPHAKRLRRLASLPKKKPVLISPSMEFSSVGCRTLIL